MFYLQCFSIVSILLILGACTLTEKKVHRASTDVIKYTDGDTFTLKSGTTIRVQSIDTPEMNYKGNNGEPLSEEARKRTKMLLAQNSFELHEKSKRVKDPFNRLLRSVYFPENKLYLSEILVSEGLARVYYDDTIDSEFLRNVCTKEVLARKQNIGIWQDEYKEIFLAKKPSCPDGI